MHIIVILHLSRPRNSNKDMEVNFLVKTFCFGNFRVQAQLITRTNVKECSATVITKCNHVVTMDMTETDLNKSNNNLLQAT